MAHGGSRFTALRWRRYQQRAARVGATSSPQPAHAPLTSRGPRGRDFHRAARVGATSPRVHRSHRAGRVGAATREREEEIDREEEREGGEGGGGEWEFHTSPHRP